MREFARVFLIAVVAVSTYKIGDLAITQLVKPAQAAPKPTDKPALDMVYRGTLAPGIKVYGLRVEDTRGVPYFCIVITAPEPAISCQ